MKSIEEVLLKLVEDSDLVEVVSCLDIFIAPKDKCRVKLYDEDGEQVYPVEGA